jgi:hypothetical protein
MFKSMCPPLNKILKKQALVLYFPEPAKKPDILFLAGRGNKLTIYRSGVEIGYCCIGINKVVFILNQRWGLLPADGRLNECIEITFFGIGKKRDQYRSYD